MKTVIKSGVEPEDELLLRNQLVQLNLRTVDWTAALNQSRESEKVLNRMPNYSFVNKMRVRNGVAELEFFIGRNYDEVGPHVSLLIDEVKAQTGETFDTSGLYVLQALYEREIGNFDASIKSIDHALALLVSHTSVKNPFHLKFQTFAVMIKADGGDIEGAKAVLKNAQSNQSQGPNRWIETMQAYIALKEQGSAAATEIFEVANTDLKRARSYMRLNYVLDEMTESGMVWE